MRQCRPREGMIPEWKAAAPSRKVRLRKLTGLSAVGDSDDSPDSDRTPPLSSLREVARSIYGADATGYAAGRPDYPEQLYRLLGQRCGLRTGSMALEIGAGTGLVTRRLVADGAQVMAVEPDEGMAAHLRGSVGGHLDLVVDTFERASLPESHFDLAVAATSFHWVDQAVGVPKLGRLLRPGGWAAVWWTIFDDPEAQDPFRDALAHRWGRPDPGGQRNVGFQLDSAARCHDLRHRGGLDRVSCDKIRWTCELTAEQLSALYGSMISVRRLPGDEHQELLRAIAELADRDFGGTVSRPFVTVLYTGRRPPRGRSEP